MSDLLRLTKGLSITPKSVLILGARSEVVLNWLFSLKVENVVLVEPEIDLFEKAKVLHRSKGSPDNISVQLGVPFFQSKQKKSIFFKANSLGFSSSLEPNDIKNIRPDLSFSECELPIVPLKPLLKKLGINEGAPSLLISQLNGGELNCDNSELFNAFTSVIIQTSQKPLFGENSFIDQIRNTLDSCDRDYILLAESIPPFVNVVTCKPTNALRAQQYYQQKHQNESLYNEVLKQLEDTKRQQSEAAKTHDIQQKQMTNELEDTKRQLSEAAKTHDIQQKQVLKELESTKRQLSEAAKTHDLQQKQASKELESTKRQLSEAAKTHDIQQKQVSKELESSKRQLSEAAKAHDLQQKQMTKELESSKRQLSEAAKTHDIHQKQMSKELESTKRQIETISQDRAALQKKITEAQNALTEQQETYDRKLEEVKDSYSQLELEKKDLNSELVSFKEKTEKELKELNSTLSRNLDELQNCQEHVKRLIDEKENLKNKLVADVNRAKELERRHIKSVNVTSKMNLKLQGDLDELRLRYAEKVESEQELTELVNELYVKLKQASEYYYILEEKYPEIAGNSNE